MNLWSGRVPFLLGAAFAVGALIAVRSRRPLADGAAHACSILASPVAAAFLAMGLSGTFLTTRTKDWRPIIAWAVGTVAVGLVLRRAGLRHAWSGAVLDLAGARGVRRADPALPRAPPDHLRTTIWVSGLAAVVLWADPERHGLELRPLRLVLPAGRGGRDERAAHPDGGAAGASRRCSSARRPRSPTCATPARPVSTVGYYKPLAAELDTHRGAAQLPGRGRGPRGARRLRRAARPRDARPRLGDPGGQGPQLRRSNKNPLDPRVYKIWLHNNAVGYVALPSTSVGGQYPEYDLVQERPRRLPAPDLGQPALEAVPGREPDPDRRRARAAARLHASRR